MSWFVFQWPLMLLLLPVGILWWQLLSTARRKREALMEQFNAEPDQRRKWRDTARLVAVVLLMIALARPGIAPERLSVANFGRDVVFVVDVSQSMLAEDAAPSRLEVAKQGVRDALDQLGSARAALVIYAGSSSILCPLTHDHDFVRFMLEQAAPRSVDFGGTQLISAVEKVVDQVLLEGREGVQDLVLLTDGEDHRADFERIAEELGEVDAGLLVIGIGDAERGAQIPQIGEEGQKTWLEFQGQPVETRLNRASLQQLVSAYAAGIYIEAGTSPFDLAVHYAEFVSQLPTAGGGDQGNTVVVYQEAGLFLVLLALLLWWLAEFRVMLRRLPWQAAAVTYVAATVGATGLQAQPMENTGTEVMPQEGHESREETKILSVSEQFQQAQQRQLAGELEEALNGYFELEAQANRSSQTTGVTPAELAAVYYNMALCRIQLAQQRQEVSAQEALSDARGAQQHLLLAKQLAPDLRLASQHLDQVAQVIQALQLKVEEEAKDEQQLNEQLQELISKLQVLVEQEEALLKEVPAPAPRRRGKPAANPATALPDPAGFERWPERQRMMVQTGLAIQAEMAVLNQGMTVQIPGMPAAASLLAEPLQWMEMAVTHQQAAVTPLGQQNQWPLARRELALAIQWMRKILDQLAGQTSDDSEEWDEYDEMEEDWDMEESDMDGGQSDSQSSSGDFAQASTMQPLPAPNYSAEEILSEEMENQQFRMQKRAAGQVGKVEKDW